MHFLPDVGRRKLQRSYAKQGVKPPRWCCSAGRLGGGECETPLYLWIVPADVAGRWRLEHVTHRSELRLAQTYQFIRHADQVATGPRIAGRVRGTRIELSISRHAAPPLGLTGQLTAPDQITGSDWTAGRIGR